MNRVFFFCVVVLLQVVVFGAPKLTVTVPDAQADQKNLAAGMVVDKTKIDDVVELKFGHVLSRIGFTAKLDKQYPDTKVKITSLKVKYKANAVKSRGVYTFGETDPWTLDGSTYMSGSVSDEVVDADVTLDNTASLTTTQVNGVNNYLMLLPQGDVDDGDMTLFAQWSRIAEIANCYVVVPDGEVTFPVARAYVDDGLSDELRVGGADSSTFTAETLWDDNSVINGTPSVSGNGKDAVMTVRTNNNQGNAVVAVKKGNDIVWSWHIWVTSYDPTSDNGWNPRNNGGSTTHTNVFFMDRNLGALAAENSLAGHGLFYQWVRKDPFPAKDNVGSFGIAEGPVTLVQAIQNPGTFYYVASGNDGDWLTPARDNTLWGGDDEAMPKTIYDPCPAGWRVPFSGADASSPWYGFGAQTYEGATPVDERGYVLGGSVQSYWPAAGYRYFTTGALTNLGAGGGYWSATFTGSNAYDVALLSGGIFPSDASNRAFGFSVRCVKEVRK
ncbi:MAG: fimbrillin family protein [Mediterranea sp.]|jgi:hypothetical protein|nr:fimbrillin family protein [Mediterranea sp.]